MQKIRVGNDVLQFPDDMDDNAIKAVIQKEYGGLQSQKQPTQAMQTSRQEQPSDNMVMLPTDTTPEQQQRGIENAKRLKEQENSFFGAGGLIDRGGKALQELPVVGGALTTGEDFLLSGIQAGANLLMPNTLGKPINEYMQRREADLEKRLPVGNQRARLATSLLAPAGTGLIKGAVIGSALTPYTGGGDTNDYIKDKTISTAVGVGGGVVAKGAGKLVSKVADDIIPLAKRAKEFGIKLRVDQIKPTNFRRNTQKLSQDIPFSGVNKQEATQKTQWNSALAKTLGNGITDTTPESINKFSQLNSAKYDKVLKNTKINVFQDDVNQLQAQVNFIKDNVSPLQFKKIDNVLKSVIGDFEQGLDNVDFKAVSATKINGLRRDLLNIASKSSGDAKNSISETADFVHDILNKSLPKNKQKLLQEANREYRNFKTIQPLLEKSTTGEINPTDLLNRVASSKYITASKENIGKDALVDLARIGKQFLPKLGGSDTTSKATQAGVFGGAITNPASLLKIGATVSGVSALNRLGQSINKSPSNVAKHLSGGGAVNNTLNAISNNADTIASQSSRMTGQAMNAMSNPQSEIQQSQPQRRTIDDIKRGFYEKKQNTVTDTDTRMQDILKRIRTQKPQTQYQFKRPEFVNDTTQAESSGNPNAKSKTSTASGLGGFTDGTWKQVQNKYGKQYGLNNKADPRQQQIATDLLAEDNAKYLKQKLKNRDISTKDLHVAHFMGAGGATRMILNIQRGQGDKLAYQTFRKEANANKPIFFDGRRPRTINEVYAVLASRENK